MVVFVVNSQGRVQSTRLTKSTGHPALDDEVMALLRRVDPFPAFPPELDRREVTVQLPVDFKLR
jgi:protein TonB